MMDEQNALMTPDEEVAMIFSSNKDDGPSTSKRARLTNQGNSSRDDDNESQFRPSESRTIGHRRPIWDDSSDSDSSSSDTKEVYPNVEAYLSSIPEFHIREHRRIPFYLELLGDNAKYIQTELPKSDIYSDEKMERIKRNYILSQLDYLIQENIRRTSKEAEPNRCALVKPFAIVPTEQGTDSD